MMRSWLKFVAAAMAIASMGGAAAAATTPGACLTRGEAEALVGFALPSLVTGVAQKCSAGLPPSAYLPRNSARLAASFRPTADAAWPAARNAFQKLAREQMPSFLSDTAIRALLEAGLSAGLTEKINARDCAMVDRLFELTDPLPASHLSGLIALVIELGSRSSDDALDKAGFRICRAAA